MNERKAERERELTETDDLLAKYARSLRKLGDKTTLLHLQADYLKSRRRYLTSELSNMENQHDC